MKQYIKNSLAAFSSGMSSTCISLQNNPFILSPHGYKEPAPYCVSWGSAGMAVRTEAKPQAASQALPSAFFLTSKPFPWLLPAAGGGRTSRSQCVSSASDKC